MSKAYCSFRPLTLLMLWLTIIRCASRFVQPCWFILPHLLDAYVGREGGAVEMVKTKSLLVAIESASCTAGVRIGSMDQR